MALFHIAAPRLGFNFFESLFRHVSGRGRIRRVAPLAPSRSGQNGLNSHHKASDRPLLRSRVRVVWHRTLNDNGRAYQKSLASSPDIMVASSDVSHRIGVHCRVFQLPWLPLAALVMIRTAPVQQAQGRVGGIDSNPIPDLSLPYAPTGKPGAICG
ncbi:hypothetical protein CMQ_6559 [Grosmannia clavigera kw1407]|uniref:Uncharacterized protein n=1 Tax=Grosmannia clavigera (strain kw1407 / UAMH 11150) TaxID=655863 RepID=F0X705_GROCL|nr:uncharacterized protein CMQ_6559 [Grosmannia clavigera kw1407]EFX06238.1 hypothetical protein CMQ_6559 [Grosmannia clavigera kw1407]